MKEKKKSDTFLSETPGQATPTSRKRAVPAKDHKVDVQIDLRELIARRAYELYKERGGYHGDDVNDWLRAEAEVKSALRPEKRRSAMSRVRAIQ